MLVPGSGLRFSARADKFLSSTGSRPALGPAYPGFKRPHFHQFENQNWILYRLFHIVNLATRFVRVKAVFKHNFYSKHFFGMVCETEEDITPVFQPSSKLGQHQDKEKNASVITTTSRSVLGPTQPLIQWLPGALSVGVKRPGREADHSPPPSSAEVQNA
jgi:hypothetical protein